MRKIRKRRERNRRDWIFVGIEVEKDERNIREQEKGEKERKDKNRKKG